MTLGGLALAFSRLIDDSVVVLENIFRRMDLGESPIMAAERGANEVALPVLASTLTTAVVFFPVTFLYGVSRYLFSALALTVVLALLASYLVAMTIVPLFCSKFIKAGGAGDSPAQSHPHSGLFDAAFQKLATLGIPTAFLPFILSANASDPASVLQLAKSL